MGRGDGSHPAGQASSRERQHEVERRTKHYSKLLFWDNLAMYQDSMSVRLLASSLSSLSMISHL